MTTGAIRLNPSSLAAATGVASTTDALPHTEILDTLCVWDYLARRKIFDHSVSIDLDACRRNEHAARRKAAEFDAWASCYEEELRKIIYIDLDGKGLTTLPPWICIKLPNLQQLNVCHNQITTLPTEIGQLFKLQALDVCHNQLTALPPEMERLSDLQFLNISSNKLNTLPQGIERLSNLERLHASHNQFNALPNSLANLSSRCLINFAYNQLSAETIAAFQAAIADVKQAHPDRGPQFQG